MLDHQASEIDPLRPLVDKIKNELRAELLADLRAEMTATKAEASPKRIMLSIADVCERYGSGRRTVKDLIRSGRLQAVERLARGGRVGQFLHLADCERVLAGRK